MPSDPNLGNKDGILFNLGVPASVFRLPSFFSLFPVNKTVVNNRYLITF
jgi:hypothetical protein